ncbi:MAG: uroporphyrinogen decarboxylase [Terriglobia bacterium]
MSNLRVPQASFGGLTVAAFESRRAAELATLISNLGGVARVAASVREVPLAENSAALDFGQQLFAGKIDAVVCLTGVGTRALLEILEKRFAREEVVSAFQRVKVVARGPKPVKVLQEYGIPFAITAPEPNTWRELLRALDQNSCGLVLRGSCVAVQEYGVPNDRLLEELKRRGANVMQVPVYLWALPEDRAPLEALVHELIDGAVQVALFTSAVQVYHVLQVASESGLKERLLGALKRCVVCSVGPTCSEALAANGIAVDIEPEHPKMGALIHEAAKRGGEVLKKKSGTRSLEPVGAAGSSPAATAREPGATTAERRAAPWHDSRFLKACRREPVDATPIWLMRQAGRYMKEYRDLRARVPFLELCKSPELVSEVTVTAAQRLNVDAAIIFADLLLIVEPLGFHLEYGKGEGPVIAPRFAKAADLDRLREVEPEDSLDYLYAAIRRTRAELNPRIPLIGFSGAPFTLASYLIEGGGSRNYRYTKTLMYDDPGAWRALMEHLARNLACYTNAQIAAGVQAVQIFDSWVGCLGPEEYREFVLPYSRQLIQGITPGTPVIHFGTGSAMLLEAMRDAGGDVIGVDSRIELDQAWARIGYDRGIQGNLDPVVLYANPAYIRARVERVLKQAAGRAGHIFNLGHGILPDTPVENVLALVEMVRELSSR